MKDMVQLIKNLGRIKKIKRAGWVREGIEDAESVADHSCRVALMAVVFGDKLGVDKDRLIKMALLHDLGEGFIGDIVVERGIEIDNKSRNEKDANEIKALDKLFEATNTEDSLSPIYKDAINFDGNEGKILKQLERLEMAVQALEYEEECGIDLSKFFENAFIHISHPFLKEVLEATIGLRKSK